MRKIDKKNNMVKTNLLTEKRYLESKALLNEEGITVKKIVSDFKYEIFNGDVFLGSVIKDADEKQWTASDENYKALDSGTFEYCVGAFGKRKESKKYNVYYKDNGNLFMRNNFTSKKAAIDYINKLNMNQDFVDGLEIK